VNGLSEALTTEELADLEQLVSALRGVSAAANAFVLRLDGAEDDSLRARVCDRLRCVLQDSLSPALRDCGSILIEAQGGGMA
jgi:hypothetical protein